VPERSTYEYVIVRIVPRVERGECLNAGVVLVCRPRAFLRAKIALDRERLKCVSPFLKDDEIDEVARQLELIPRIAAGDVDAGPIARLELGERWHWLSAPSSTILQPSPPHTGLCIDPERELQDLFQQMVAVH
jgi:hypothetical protein